jgi:GNAT superfamily N-acetyltransferase
MIPAEVVAAEAAAWVWYPPDAEVLETAELLLVRWPEYVGQPPTLIRIDPAADPEQVLATATGQARAWSADRVTVPVLLAAPIDLEDLLVARGATPYETVDVLAADLTGPGPALDAPGGIDLWWRLNTRTVLDGEAVSREAFGEGEIPDEATARELARLNAADFDAGVGTSLVAYLDSRPVGVAGVTVVGPTARLWGGGVVPAARGRGVYRAMLQARLDLAIARGATMALVKGRVETSGPILRRAGFHGYGEERSYRLPVA